ncbi:hypothetical protein SAMN05444266_106487 [Chitinophaga jiangningensis]|uniref:Uncharacterized protein n=1 Tax=Chitinophaga jiangningensis TaxID=1419482 RepID=A0A1M7GCK1_9BACT|nr:hypothetical protein [Chitinophaga jiangningensis]SHM13589.1 hypothetical protein SAMN05444266_106487 [Chitinophaga jiangningensis]
MANQDFSPKSAILETVAHNFVNGGFTAMRMDPEPTPWTIEYVIRKYGTLGLAALHNPAIWDVIIPHGPVQQAGASKELFAKAMATEAVAHAKALGTGADAKFMTEFTDELCPRKVTPKIPPKPKGPFDETVLFVMGRELKVAAAGMAKSELKSSLDAAAQRFFDTATAVG